MLKRFSLTVFMALQLFAAKAYCDVTVSALLPANTSAGSRFPGAPNGALPGSASLSKVNVHTLLYPGATTQVLAHYLPWWGPDPRGLDAGYRSDDPQQALRTFTDMQSRGVDGVVVDWYGKGHFTDNAWKASMPMLERVPSMSFSIMIDSGTFKFNAPPGKNLTDTILYHLDYLAREYFPSKQYLRVGGHPVVSEFGMESVGNADWERIQKAHPEIDWIHIHAAGLNRPESKGAFVWVEAATKAIYGDRPADLRGLNRFYNIAAIQKDKIVIGGVWKGFDDSKAPWAAASPHYLPQDCGRTWLSTFKELDSHYNARQAQLPFVQLVTWNDYEEGTALESGIASCVKITASLSGHTISVALTYPDTVDHLELYQALKPESYRLLGSYSVSGSIMPLPDSKPATYFIKAVGKPFMQNVISDAIVVR